MIAPQIGQCVVPAERMKARKEHKVPLAERAMEVLSLARELNPQDNHLVFPASRSGKELSDMALTELLRRLDIPGRAPRVPQQLQGLVLQTVQR